MPDPAAPPAFVQRADREWGLVRAALQALTRVPVAAPHGPGVLAAAACYMPLVGMGLGGVAATVLLLAAGAPGGVAALLSLAVTLLLTGALHEDGLADCCDGMFGGRDRAHALAIMRDSRVGAFGVLGLIVVVGVKVACTAAAGPWALIAAHGASRFWAVLPTALLPPARADGLAAAMAAPPRARLALAGAFGLVALLLLGHRAGAALVASSLAAAAMILWARHRLGGYTGDVLGAVQQVTEVAVLLAAAWHAD